MITTTISTVPHRNPHQTAPALVLSRHALAPSLNHRRQRSALHTAWAGLGDQSWRRAVNAAGLNSLLSSPASIQLLVPSDRAFADLLHELKLSWDEFCGDLPRLRELLLGHVLLMPCSLTAPGESSMLRTVNQGIVHLRGAGRLQDAHGRQAQVLGQLAQQHPQAPCGYLIDRVLRPAELGLLELLAQQPEHSAFLDALRQTGASSWLSGGGPFTVLAPSNSGWATQLGAAAERRAELACPHCELGAPSERERHPLHELRALVSRHLVPGRWLSDELPWGSQLPCLGEQTLRLSPLGLMGEGAAAQTLQRGSDRVARNGVLHRVN